MCLDSPIRRPTGGHHQHARLGSRHGTPREVGLPLDLTPRLVSLASQVPHYRISKGPGEIVAVQLSLTATMYWCRPGQGLDQDCHGTQSQLARQDEMAAGPRRLLAAW